MSFTSEIKNEILSVKISGAKAQRAFVSAFLRTCGSVEIVSDKFGFSVVSDRETVGYFCKVVKILYKKECAVETGASHQDRATARLIGGDCLKILIDLGILKNDGGITVALNIGEDLICDESAFRAYIVGAFLGSGSITVPKVEDKKKSKTGYHLEIVFSKYVTANDFSNILAERGFMPRLVERKDQFVVYFKSVEEIENFIGLCGANGAYLKLTELEIQKGIRNAENRKLNCEMSNLTKTIDASIKQRDDIRLIAELIGLDGLKQSLKDVAVARLKSDDDISMQQLADSLGISKSCLSHRLRKLSEIAQTLKL